MSDKVLVLRWAGSAYDSLGGLLELMAHELAAEGFQAELFTVDDQDGLERLAQVLAQGRFAFALTMSGIGVDLLLAGRSIWEATQTPLFNWNCDHPCYFPARHAVRNPFLLHGYVFPDHARYSIRHMDANGMTFAVHLGVPPRNLFPDAPLPLSGRNGRIMFSKSGRDTNVLETEWRSYPTVLRDILFAAAEELLASNAVDILPTLQRIGEPLGLFFQGNNKLTMMLIWHLDDYIRFRRGNLLMQTVLRYPVDVFGQGWEHIERPGTSAVFHGSTSWRTILTQLPRYVGALSINPLVEASVHDRVLFALAAGVAPITQHNEFSRCHMAELAHLTFGFGSGDFSRISIEAALEAALANPAEALALTENTYQTLTTNFSLRHSAKLIIQFAALHSVNAPWLAD